MAHRSREDRIAAVTAIREPLPRRAYDVVASAPQPLSRDEVAEALGAPRATVAFHLDKLAEAGLLEIGFARRSGRSGPGAGRPAKFYSPAPAEVELSLPEREYHLMGDILATAIERADASSRPVTEVLGEVARERGRQLGSGRRLSAALEAGGYRPTPEGERIALGNCPFHRLAQDHTALVCQANLGLVEGITEGCAEPGYRAEFEPGEGPCCVAVAHN